MLQDCRNCRVSDFKIATIDAVPQTFDIFIKITCSDLTSWNLVTS